MAAGQNHCIFSRPNATARLIAYLQYTQAVLLISPCKNAVNLACGHRRGALGPPSADLEASIFFLRFLDFRTFFLGAWSPPPWPFPVAPRRPQEVSRHDPNHLWMQKSDFAKMLVFPQENKGFLRVGWPSCAVFFALRPPPRAIWTGISSCDPWETPLPYSTKNKLIQSDPN